jgi:hypothetical protein
MVFQQPARRDDANPAELRLKGWKKDWPHYVRVRDAVFVAGTLANGISLNRLMGTLGSDAFAPTQRNALAGNGNTDPRKSYMRKAAVMLTPQSMGWVEKRLEEAFRKHGKITANTARGLAWPQSHQNWRSSSR